MTTSLLPNDIIQPTKTQPKRILLYGAPKVGKTYGFINRKDTLILDYEDGASMYPCQRIDMRKDSYNTTLKVFEELKQYYINKKEYKYKFIVIDTIDIVEDVVDKYETDIYNKMVDDKNLKDGKKSFDRVNSIVELAYGAGYGKLRNSVIEIVRMYEKVCSHLIIISHIKGKFLAGEEKKSNDGSPNSAEIDLTGKLSTMICSLCDAIGFISVSLDGKRYVNFKKESSLDLASGSRFSYLEKEKMEFNIDNIFPII